MMSLIQAAEAAAKKIQENAGSYMACQAMYGVDVEVLIDGEWSKEYCHEDEIKAVRLYDCDGEKSRTCTTVEQVRQEESTWLALIAASDEE